jgi:hypothetical protein
VGGSRAVGGSSAVGGSTLEIILEYLFSVCFLLIKMKIDTIYFPVVLACVSLRQEQNRYRYGGPN